MDWTLSPVEARVLGCLMEKEVTTPDQYPLSLNGLCTACNQKSNREPVMDLQEDTVRDALEHLKQLHLVRQRHSAGSRVEKFVHTVSEKLGLDRADAAVITMLLLRGPQTAGELRTRTRRMYSFASPSDVEERLQALKSREKPVVELLEREPGKREQRYAHLFCGGLAAEAATEPEASDAEEVPKEPVGERPGVRVRARGDEGRIEILEREVATLKQRVSDLQRKIEDMDRRNRPPRY